MNMKLFQEGKLSVHIVEQHNDVVPFIHRAIASKKLPFSGIPIIHLDSHPDLLINTHLDADTVFQTKDLYESLSIENWLLPLCYAKHVDHVVWVRPPWANQIQTSEKSFTIGKCCHSGKLRLSSKENYFLTDALFCTATDLENGAECKLTVVELRPHNWKDLDPLHKDSTQSSQRITSNETTSSCENEVELNSNQEVDGTNEAMSGFGENDELFMNYEKWTNHLQDNVTSKPYILDVDLDFFTTKNPFREIFQPEEKEILQRIFKCPVLKGSSDEEVKTYTQLREEQLDELEIFFTALDDNWCGEDLDGISEAEISNMSLAELVGMDAEELEYFTQNVQEDLRNLSLRMLQNMKQREITFPQLFDFGCTLDDTELPHHVSTENQIEALGTSFRHVLGNLPKPAVVTISRSSHDEYCPKDQVNQIEHMVLKILTDIYGSLHVTKNFEE